MNILRMSLLGLILVSTNVCFAQEKTRAPNASTFPEGDWRAELRSIDQEIDKLTNQRNLYLAKATRFQNQGDRLQFEHNDLIDARRAWQQAQIHREIATRIQEEIDALQIRRAKLIEAHGGSVPAETQKKKSSKS